ncbi:hypothetical protein EDC14_103238 [Hydrogenispora ethanolica]|uniref:Glycosyl transferase family 1 n=1 Tax=Hydrogenispora ethanolica TaxID=1082276 RepID=A0A4R1R826_HYDET|nr:hypothetical protein [Hydrogenispora ethanolica]TCL61805.1 hypothetical protein EDC14_103238 [Hydrogenispora ethanolica]
MAKKRPIRILLMGYPYFVHRLQELGWSAEYQLIPLPRTRIGRYLALLRADLIYLIGGDLRHNRFFNLAFLLGKRLVVHWVGSDILAMKEWHEQKRRFASWMVKKAEHWAEVDWTAAELLDLGIQARIVPLTPAAFPEKTYEIPSKFVVLTYLPPGKEEFYGEKELIQLARKFPEIVFLAAAASSADPKPEWPSNLIPIGWVNNMSELYREVIALVRLTQHDGLSFMVLEALAQARYVIWSYPLTGAAQARNCVEAAPVLADLYRAFCHQKLTLNSEGRNMVIGNYTPQAVLGQIAQGIAEILAR